MNMIDTNIHHISAQFPSNNYITNRTRQLLHNLVKIGRSDQVILGHQSTNTLSKTGWRGLDESDFKDVTGQFPGMVAYDIGGIERGNDRVWLDGTTSRVVDAIKYAYGKGLLVSISWHTRNPIDVNYDQKNRAGNGKVKDFGNTVNKILNNKTIQQTYLKWLDMLATFFDQLVDDSGVEIPVLFRPFHECTGKWFWWGTERCSDEEYIKLYRLTHEYLSKQKGVNNILWVYNTDRVSSEEEYTKRYPGNDYIDLCSMDFYDYENYKPDVLKARLSKSLDAMRSASKKLNKSYFIAEGGKKNNTDVSYFTARCTQFFPKDLVAFCFWVNSKNNYYVPFKGDPNAEDFKKMIRQNGLLLEDDVRKLKIYS